MILTNAAQAHIPELVRISKAAFESDIVMGLCAGGPPEYDCVEWHREMQRQGRLFAALEGDTVIGGAILFDDARDREFLYVGRIFITPELFGRGYGLRLMEQIEEMHPHVTKFCLDTPAWNVRTNRFYRKLGYRRDGEMVYYEKTLRPERKNRDAK